MCVCQVKTWLQEVGEVRLKSLEEPADSLVLLNEKQQDYKDFCTTAYVRHTHTHSLSLVQTFLLAHTEDWSPQRMRSVSSVCRTSVNEGRSCCLGWSAGTTCRPLTSTFTRTKFTPSGLSCRISLSGSAVPGRTSSGPSDSTAS